MTDVSTDGRLVLDGGLTVRNAAALCATLREAIAQHSVLSVDCAGAEEIDVSFIQLLIATRASATLAGKTVSLAARPDAALLNALTRAGFQAGPADSPPFWFEAAAQ